MLLKNSRLMRFVTGGAALWMAVLALVSGAATAEASGCRTDPIIVLSNGAQLQMDATISTSYNNVQSVVYTVHAPRGSAPLLIIYTDNPLRYVETVRYIADGPSNVYTIDTVVTTNQGNTSVTTTSALVSVLRLTLDSDRASGAERQHLGMSLGR